VTENDCFVAPASPATSAYVAASSRMAPTTRLTNGDLPRLSADDRGSSPVLDTGFYGALETRGVAGQLSKLAADTRRVSPDWPDDLAMS
jgi:hypothetical protein